MLPRGHIALWFVVAAAASGCRLLGVVRLACVTTDDCTGALVCVDGECAPEAGGVDAGGDAGTGGGSDACGKGGVLSDGFDDEIATRLRWNLNVYGVAGQVVDSSMRFEFADAAPDGGRASAQAASLHRFDLTDSVLTFEIEELPSAGSSVEISLLPNPGSAVALASIQQTDTEVVARVVDADGDTRALSRDGVYKYWRFRPDENEIVLEVAGDDQVLHTVLQRTAPARLDALYAVITVQGAGGRFALAGVNEDVPVAPNCPASMLAGGLEPPVATSPFTPVASLPATCATTFGDGAARITSAPSATGAICALESWRAYDLRSSRIVVDIAALQAPPGARVFLRAQYDYQNLVEVAVDDTVAFGWIFIDNEPGSGDEDLDAATASLELVDDGTELVANVIDVDGNRVDLVSVASPAFLDRVEISFGVVIDATSSGGSAQFSAVRGE